MLVPGSLFYPSLIFASKVNFYQLYHNFDNKVRVFLQENTQNDIAPHNDTQHCSKKMLHSNNINAMLGVTIYNIMLSVIIPSAVMLNVSAPTIRSPLLSMKVLDDLLIGAMHCPRTDNQKKS